MMNSTSCIERERPPHSQRCHNNNEQNVSAKTKEGGTKEQRTEIGERKGERERKKSDGASTHFLNDG